MEQKVDEFFPKKRIKIFRKDKEWMTEKIQKIRRMKTREYRRNQRSEKFKRLHKKFLELKSYHSKKYIKEQIETLRNSDPSKFYRLLKEVGAQPGEENKSSFTLVNHSENNLNDSQ